MKRSLILALCAFLLTGAAMLAQGVAVPPNGIPAPGLPPSSYACYLTCILPKDIVAEDFTQNGWLDLAVSCSGTGAVFYYPNSGWPRGIFGGPVALVGPTVPGGPLFNASRLISGTINAYNGFPDLGVLCSLTPVGTTTQLRVLAPPAPGAATLPAAVPAPYPAIIDVAGGNFCNANHLGLAVVTSVPAPPGGLEVWGWVAGNYASLTGGVILPTAALPVALVVADFDQNGWDDVAVVTAQPTVEVFFNPGGNPPAFAGPSLPTAINVPFPTAIGVGDFNADGFPDIVVVGTAADRVTGLAQVLQNNVHQAAGNFGPLPAMLTWGFNPRDVEVLDADGNGRDDFVVANWKSHTLTVFLSDAMTLQADTRNTGAPCLSATSMKPKDRLDIDFRLFKIELQCGFYPIALTSGDFDRNGKMDVAVALQSADDELCAQNKSCIEVDYDIACGFVAATGSVIGQTQHSTLPVDPNQRKERTECPECKEEPCKKEPCAENVPPKAEIQTEGETKNP